MWLDSKAVNCPQKWGNFRDTNAICSVAFSVSEPRSYRLQLQIMRSGVSWDDVTILLSFRPKSEPGPHQPGQVIPRLPSSACRTLRHR